jgi:hypothetical protein
MALVILQMQFSSAMRTANSTASPPDRTIQMNSSTDSRSGKATPPEVRRKRSFSHSRPNTYCSLEPRNNFRNHGQLKRTASDWDESSQCDARSQLTLIKLALRTKRCPCRFRHRHGHAKSIDVVEFEGHGGISMGGELCGAIVDLSVYGYVEVSRNG